NRLQVLNDASDRAAELLAVGAAHQRVIAKQAAELGDRAWRGSEDAMLNAGCLDCRANPLAGRISKLLDGRLAFAANDEANERGKRWIEMCLAAGELSGGEASVIVVDRRQNRVVVGGKRLHQHAPPFVAAARAAGDLGDELKRPLGGPQ